MADFYIWLDGLTGDSSAAGRAGWVDILSFSWGAAEHDDDASATAFQDLSITKPIDRTSPTLALYCGNGQRIDRILLEAVTYGEVPRTVLRYELEGCYVTAISQSGSQGSDLVELIAIRFDRVEWQYVPQLASGEPAPAVRESFVVTRTPQPAGGAPAPSQRGASRPQAAQPALQLNVYVPKTAFIVMWMDPERPELEDVHQTIKDVCQSFGIRALRADDVQHDERITDVILEQIRTSEFVIADLTGERPNVYYEVGHAHAMGKRPILVRRKGSALHFDLSVHNVREYRNLTELRELLSRRFQAVT